MKRFVEHLQLSYRNTLSSDFHWPRSCIFFSVRGSKEQCRWKVFCVMSCTAPWVWMMILQTFSHRSFSTVARFTMPEGCCTTKQALTQNKVQLHHRCASLRNGCLCTQRERNENNQLPLACTAVAGVRFLFPLRQHQHTPALRPG